MGRQGGKGGGGRGGEKGQQQQYGAEGNVKELMKLWLPKRKLVVCALELITNAGECNGLYSANSDGTLTHFDNAGNVTRTLQVGGELRSLASAGHFLFVGLHNGALALHLPSGEQTTIAHPTRVFSLLPIVEQSAVLTGGVDGVIRAWKLDEQSAQFKAVGEYNGHEASVVALVRVADFIVSASADGRIKAFDLASGACRCTVQRAHAGIIGSLQEFQGYLLSCGQDGTVRVWSGLIDRGELHVEYTHPAQLDSDGRSMSAQRMCGVAESDGTSSVAVAYEGEKSHVVKFWQLPSFSERASLMSKYTIWCLASGPDGQVFTGDKESLIRVLHLGEHSAAAPADSSHLQQNGDATIEENGSRGRGGRRGGRGRRGSGRGGRNAPAA